MAESTIKSEYTTLLFSFGIVVSLMICSLTFNELTNSNIIEVDAGSYVISAIIGLITIYISNLKQRPKDINHPLGFSGYVPILNLIRSFMIVLICIKAIGGSLGDIYNGPPKSDHGIMLTYVAVTTLFNVLAFIVINRTGNKINSALLKTDALEWKTDIAYNISILIAVLISYGLEFTPYNTYSDYTDPVFCIVISLFLIYSPVIMFKDNVQLLSVSSIDKEMQEKIIQAFYEQAKIIKNYNPQFTVLHVGGVLWVNIELEITRDTQESFDNYQLIKDRGEKILNEITLDNKISFVFQSK